MRHCLVFPEAPADDDPRVVLNYVERLEPWTSKMRQEVSKLAKEVYGGGADTDMEEKEQANEGGAGSPPIGV